MGSGGSGLAPGAGASSSAAAAASGSGGTGGSGADGEGGNLEGLVLLNDTEVGQRSSSPQWVLHRMGLPWQSQEWVCVDQSVGRKPPRLHQQMHGRRLQAPPALSAAADRSGGKTPPSSRQPSWHAA